MNRTLVPALCLAACVALQLACQPAPETTSPANTTTNTTVNTNAATAETTRKAPPIDLEQLAQRLVTQSAGVKEGDIVLVSGGARDLELLENIVTNVEKVGGHPLLTLNSDRMAKKYFAEVPEKYDSREPKLGLRLAELVNVTINVDSNEAEGLLADVTAARRAAVAKAGQPVGEAFLRRNVRQVNVGNGLYPTSWRAKHFEMAEDELSRTFWGGVNVEYSSLQATGEKVKAVLAAGNEMHITNPNGTDLRVRVQGRPVFVSDGIISPEDMQKGGAAVSVYLPAGEVYCAPVPNTAEGKVVVNRDFFDGKEIQNLTLTFAGGKLTSMTGSGPGFEAFKAAHDAAGEGKDLFAFVDLGINPNIRLSPASKLGNWVPAGMVTVGTGNNTWAGGDNKIAYGITAYLPGSTVMLDGKPLVENGTLKI